MERAQGLGSGGKDGWKAWHITERALQTGVPARSMVNAGHAAGEDVNWNFNKFLIDKWGRPVKRYPPGKQGGGWLGLRDALNAT